MGSAFGTVKDITDGSHVPEPTPRTVMVTLLVRRWRLSFRPEVRENKGRSHENGPESLRLAGADGSKAELWRCTLAFVASNRGSKRTDLQRHESSVPGRRVVQGACPNFDAGRVVSKHHASGEEFIYVLGRLRGNTPVEGQAAG